MRARARGEALGPLAGAPFAVKNLFDIEGLPTRAGSKINRERAPAERRRDAGRSGWRRPARCWSARSTWANTPMISPARTRTTAPRAIRTTSTHMSGRIVGRLGLGGRGRAGADRARLRHQRLDPRAFLALRHFRPEADLWPAFARGHVSVRLQLRPSRVRSRARVADLAASYDAMQGPDARDPAQSRASVEPTLPRLEERRGGPAHRPARRLFRARRATPRRFEAVERVAGALEASRDGRVARSRARARGRLSDHHGRGRGAACRPAARARRRFRSRRARPADRGRDAAGRLGGQGAEIPSLVPRARARNVPRRRHPARARDALPRAADRPEDLHARRRGNAGAGRISASSPSRFRSSACRWSAVPVWTTGVALPIGVQVIAPPWREDLALRVARALEREGVVSAPVGAAVEEGAMSVERDFALGGAQQRQGRRARRHLAQAGRSRRQCRPELRPHSQFRRRRHGGQAARANSTHGSARRSSNAIPIRRRSRCACARSMTASCCSRRCPI